MTLSILLLIVISLLLFSTIVILLRRNRKNSDNVIAKASIDINLGAVPTYRKSFERLSAELDRVRRYGRPLSLIVLRLESDQLLVDIKRNLVSESANGGAGSYNEVMYTIQLVFSLMGSTLDQSLRESDIPTYDAKNNQYVILLPECTREHAEKMERRLKKLLFKKTAGHLVAGISEFPADGLIIDDLVKSAMAACTEASNGQLPTNNNNEQATTLRQSDQYEERRSN